MVMSNEQGDEACVANAANWLRLVFHSLTCNNPACVLGDCCAGGKALFSHVLTCTSQGECAVPSCTSIRRLTFHWLRCQDAHCRLCARVWRDLSGQDCVREPYQERDLRERCSPEAPGTPDRNGATTFTSSSYNNRAVESNGEGFPISGRGRDVDVDLHIAEVESDSLTYIADRAVFQLQEATTYMRYLLHCLMCRRRGMSHSRAPGIRFWSNVLAPQDLLGGVSGGWGLAPEGHPEAAAAGAVAPATAGLRLLGHRLMCRNPFCALCSGTCELFTRGRALRREMPAPSGLQDMDLVVHELSLALGSFNL